MATKTFRKLVLLSTTALMTATTAHAQDAADPAAATPQSTEETEPAIVVIGSQIQGAQINEVLPVTVLDEQQIENTGASSGDELFRAIPQAGTVAFNEQNATTQNNVRGDVGSVNLRDLGTGNTLLLINGRRMNLHPGFQTELLVPVVSPDTNEIAPGSVSRIEVLRDGASAVYGADAVAGVINTVLKGNMKGGFLEADWRASDGTS
ncbi:MAG TPA: TonB-dependent receptor plug domain-containing protein, partial [Sphingorhabdus sp.]|nr:TonB-dependent receptor plug domain-containing protein [Sphingorhabdus sp.]